jgi:hypothetical protein
MQKETSDYYDIRHESEVFLFGNYNLLNFFTVIEFLYNILNSCTWI